MAGFCWEPCRWVTEQNKDGAKCGCAVLEGRSIWTGKWSETHVGQVWLGTFFSGMLNCLFSWKRDLILQCLNQRFCSYFAYKFKWQMSFIFSATLFRVDSKRLNIFSILTRRIKINMLFLTFFYKLAYIIIFFFFLRHFLLCWQQNVKLIWFWTKQIK